MIMQNPDGGDDFLRDFEPTPLSTAMNEADAPMANWRFLPHRTGRRHLRMDIGHSVGTQRPRLPQVRRPARTVTHHTADTLYYG